LRFNVSDEIRLAMMWLTLILGTFVFSAKTIAVCQSSTPDPVKQKLQDDKDKADLQKAIADDQKAIAQDEADKLKSQYSISTDKLPQGNATLGDKVNIEATILAYRAAQGASSRIADTLTGGPAIPPASSSATPPAPATRQRDCPSGFVFYDAKQMNDVWGVSVLKEQLRLMQQQGAGLNVGPDSARFFPVAAAIDAGLALLSLFKTDVNIQGVPVTGDDAALQAAIASDLQALCSAATVIDPAHFIAQLQPGASPTALLAILGAVSDLRNGISDKATKAQADIKAAQKALDDTKAKLDANTKAATDISARIQELNKSFKRPKHQLKRPQSISSWTPLKVNLRRTPTKRRSSRMMSPLERIS
jgi:hypothetical protein